MIDKIIDMLPTRATLVKTAFVAGIILALVSAILFLIVFVGTNLTIFGVISGYGGFFAAATLFCMIYALLAIAALAFVFSEDSGNRKYLNLKKFEKY